MSSRVQIAALAVIGLVAFSTVGRCYSGQRAEWEQRIASVEAFADAQQEVAREAEELATTYENRADSLAVALGNTAPEIRDRIVMVRDSTPEDLRGHPAIVERDSIIGELLVESAGWKSAFESQRQATAQLRVALKATRAARDSLRTVLDARPGQRPWWIPRLGVGVAAGFDATGRPNTIVGATLSWEVSL